MNRQPPPYGPQGPPLRPPVVVTDGGPWASHDQACAVCHIEKAVLEVETGHFLPCWTCQKLGWRLVERNRSELLLPALAIVILLAILFLAALAGVKSVAG